MDPKVNYTLVGLFVFLLGAASVAAVLWLSRADYRGVYDRYYVYMTESVSGLSPDASVKYRGVDVGRVKQIMLNPKNPEEVRLALELVRGTPVKEDTVAILETQGLTGLTTVNLMGGTRDSPRLTVKPGEDYPVIQTRPSFYFRLDAALSRILSDESLPILLNNLSNLTSDVRSVVDAQSRADLKRVLANLAKITQTLSAHRDELAGAIAKAETALDQFAALGRTMNDRLPAVVADAKESIRSFQNMNENISRTSASIQSALDANRTDVEQFTSQTLAETGLLVAELRQLTSTMQRLAQELEREPSLLIFGRARPTRGPGE
jgi:phospholipid/cholesterol/gamma-HCH transport system substrate-binding protein